MCGQRFWMLLWSTWQQRGKNYREKKYWWKIILKGNAAGSHFPFMIYFQPSFENVKMFIPTALAKDPGCTHSFVNFSALLPANEKLKKTPKIIGSTFPFLDIHLLSDFFHKNRFHPASPTEGLTSIQQLTREKAVEGCIYSICKMV